MARPLPAMSTFSKSLQTSRILRLPISHIARPSLPRSVIMPSSRRCLHSTPPKRATKTIEQARSLRHMGPFSLFSGLFFLACGLGSWWYFANEKARLHRQRTREASKGYGKPKIGGEFELLDQNGNVFTSEDMKGKFSLLYFGFSHCPDICPDELDKMAKMIDTVYAKRGNVLRPIVVTCDPHRDTPPVLKTYLADFHADMIGLTGSYDAVRAMCKKYRVYWSTPEHVKPGQDYLVDHSIYFYIMDPDGDFIEVVGREHTAAQGAKRINDHIDRFLGRKVTDESWKDEVKTDLVSRPKTAVKYNEL